MKCEKCKGEIQNMKTVIEYNQNKQDGIITFTNVPVYGCNDCDEKLSFSFRDGLIIEHYAKHHGKSGDLVDFQEIQSAYKGMPIQHLIRAY